LEERVVDLGYVADEDMPALYSAAEMLAFPSLWEGFGLPVVEAMACGTPVVASNVACLPEIAGGAALLVDPLSVDAIADAMVRIAEDSSLRESLRARGLARAAHFSWRRAAEETLAIYRRVIGS
jgi:glycosyltransferase involved in cell wall biosynthesis